MRDDARAGAQLREEFRRQLVVERGEEVERHDGGGTQVAGAHVLPDERRAIAHPGDEGTIAAVLHERTVQLDADGARAAPCRRDHDPTVTRAEVVDHVGGRDRGEVEHVLDDGGRRRHERSIGSLANGRPCARDEQDGERRHGAASDQRSAPISRR
jgi:hypothetical protein